MNDPESIFAIIHETLRVPEPRLTVTELCRIAGVSRSGYYNWVNSEGTRKKREEHDKAEFELVLEAYCFRGYKKGVRSIHMRLLHMGIVMNVKKIRLKCTREKEQLNLFKKKRPEHISVPVFFLSFLSEWHCHPDVFQITVWQSQPALRSLRRH